MALPFDPPLEPMRARPATNLPGGNGWLYEPKWDGFRALVYRDGAEVHLQSRDLTLLDRYFPDLLASLRGCLPARAVLDGEIVIAGERGLDFAALLQRVHPTAARVALLAEAAPASLVVWDLLALGDEDLRHLPLWQRRRRLEQVLAGAPPPVYMTPATRERSLAQGWLSRFAEAGLDGVVAKRLEDGYAPGERAMVKVRRARTATCVVAGFRWQPHGAGTTVGALLLGHYDQAGTLHHVGTAGGFTTARGRGLAKQLAPLRERATEAHPWHDWRLDGSDGLRLSRDGREPSSCWEPLRPERVCEVSYHQLQGDRFRHATQFRRWRPDVRPLECRRDQLKRAAFDVAAIFASSAARAPLAPTVTSSPPLAARMG